MIHSFIHLGLFNNNNNNKYLDLDLTDKTSLMRSTNYA